MRYGTQTAFLAATVAAGALAMAGGCSDTEVTTETTTTTDPGHGGSGGSAPACSTGLTDCNGTCVDTDWDPANCGSCGNACGDGEVCSLTQCGLTCLGGSTQCGELCVNTL